MILSKRERYAAWLAMIVVGIFAADRYVVRPVLQERARLTAEVQEHARKLDRATSLVSNSRRLAKKWHEVSAAGLKTDASAAESQLLHAVRDWAQESGLSLTSLKPDRTDAEKQFQKIALRATATGTMSAASRFLWRIQTASIPVRITELQVSSRKDGMDDLSMQVGISTLCLAPEPAKRDAPVSVAREERP